MDDLVKRLRDRETRREFDDWGVLDEAAARIEALTAERDALLARAEAAAKISEGHMLDPALGLTEWGQGHNAACQQVAHEIRRRFKF